MEFDKLKKLAKLLDSWNLQTASLEIIKLGGENEVAYLEDLNWKSWLKSNLQDSEAAALSTPEEKKVFWSSLKKKFQSRPEEGPLFDHQTLALVKDFDSKMMPKKNGGLFIRWLAQWALEWQELTNDNKNTILDWWSITGGVEEGQTSGDKIIQIMNPEYALQRAESYHQNQGFYFDPTDNYLTPPDQDIVYDFGDGYKIVYVPAVGEMPPYSFKKEDLKEEEIDPKSTSHDRIVEGNKMGICLGKKMRLYGDNSQGKIFSLRNAANEPCITIRAENTEEEEFDEESNLNLLNIFKVYEFQGLGNSIPSKKYADYLLKFLNEDNFKFIDKLVIEDEHNFALTKLNSRNPLVRAEAMQEAISSKKPSSIVADIFKIDWKTLQKDDPNLFQKLILKELFCGKNKDKLDPSKFGGDEEKRALLSKYWPDYLYDFNLTKEIYFLSGNKYLIEVVPQLLESTSLDYILSNHSTLSNLYSKFNVHGRKIASLIFNRIKAEPIHNFDLHKINLLIKFFKVELLIEGPSSALVQFIIKSLLEGKGNDIPKNLYELESLILSTLQQLPDYKFNLYHSKEKLSSLNPKTIQGIYQYALKGIPLFILADKLIEASYTPSPEELVQLIKNSDKSLCGNSYSIYELQKLIIKQKLDPFQLVEPHIWLRCLLQNLENSKSDLYSVSLWLTAAAPFAKELKEELTKAFKENLNFFKFALKSYTLNLYPFSKEELQEILNHHKLSFDLDKLF